MSDGERPLLEIDRYESFIRDENELTLALDKLTKSEDMKAIQKALENLQNCVEILRVDLNGMADTDEYPDLKITFSRLQDQARTESSAAKARLQRLQLFSGTTFEKSTNELKHRTPSSRGNPSDAGGLDVDTSTIQLREIEKKLANASKIGEDSLLTLQAQEEQFKKMDKTIYTISHKAKASKKTMRVMQCRDCYRKTLFTWFLIVLTLCVFGFFVWHWSSSVPVQQIKSSGMKTRSHVRNRLRRVNFTMGIQNWITSTK